MDGEVSFCFFWMFNQTHRYFLNFLLSTSDLHGFQHPGCCAARPLCVPCAVAIFASAFNALDLPFDFNYGPVLLGFVTYKAAVLSIVYEDVKGDITRAIAGNANGEREEQ